MGNPQPMDNVMSVDINRPLIVNRLKVAITAQFASRTQLRMGMSPLVFDLKKSPKVRTFGMPMWSKEELELIAPLFPEAQDKWRDRLEILGGVRRYVLEILDIYHNEFRSKKRRRS